MDFCCGGNVPLAAVCGNRGIDIGKITAELAQVTARGVEGVLDYSPWELPTN